MSVDLKRIRFTGLEGAALPDEVARVLSSVEPQDGAQPLSTLCTLRDEAASELNAAGYIASVQIPPQEVRSGEATFQVILARLVDVRVQGSAGPYASTLAARVEQLKGLDPLNRFEAERILLLAGDVPGLDVGLSLRSAGTRPGEVIGDLSIGYIPWVISANVQNYGSRAIGRETAVARMEYFGLTGLSDRTFIGASSTFDFQEQQVLQVGHYAGNSRGATVGGRLSYAWSRPDIGALDLRTQSLIAGLDVAAPVLRTVSQNLLLGGGLELIEQRVRLHSDGGSVPLNRDKLRVAFLRISGDVREPRFVGGDAYALGASLELRKGLDIFDATERRELSSEGFTPSRFEGNPTATVVRGGLDGFVGLGSVFSVGGSVQGQWANDPLLSFEEFTVGNFTIGRGYDPGATSGDRAIGFRIEPRVELPISHQIGAQLFAFHDRVTIWNLDRFATENDRTLRSWGAGIRTSLPGRLFLEAMYARPEDKALLIPNAKRAADRLLVSLTLQISPNRR